MSLSRRQLLAGLAGATAALAVPRARAAVAAAARVRQRVRAMPTLEGQGAVVQRVFPSPLLQHLDPFVLLDDFDVHAPAGFPTHPHRGFEAFTYMLEGAFHHQDNLGNDSVVHAGGFQRFCSGRGAYHSELPGPSAANRGLQLWVNLPRSRKGMVPEYQGLQAAALPVEEARGRRVREIVGYKSPADLKTEVHYLDVTLLPGAAFTRELAPGWNTLVYCVSGELDAAGEAVGRGEGLVLDAGALAVTARVPSRFVFLSGVPHHEPILLRGPFVD